MSSEMGYWFTVGLTWIVIVTGLIALIDILIFAPKRHRRFNQAVSGQEYLDPPLNPKGNWIARVVTTVPYALLALLKLLGAWLLWKKDWYCKRLKKQRQDLDAVKIEHHKETLAPNVVVEYCRSFFPVLFLVLFIRSFLYAPYIIPTGSLEPSFLPGDFIIANKYDYGVRLPVTHTQVFSGGKPQRGDIFLFRSPPNPHVDFIKRVVGLPGDKISYINKVFYINGKEMKQTTLGHAFDTVAGHKVSVILKEENLGGVKHKIYINPAMPAYNFKDLVVPKGHYFAIGDNRDNSADSRYWGFVPQANLIGKATMLFLSKVPGKWQFRWDRVGRIGKS